MGAQVELGGKLSQFHGRSSVLEHAEGITHLCFSDCWPGTFARPRNRAALAKTDGREQLYLHHVVDAFDDSACTGSAHVEAHDTTGFWHFELFYNVAGHTGYELGF